MSFRNNVYGPSFSGTYKTAKINFITSRAVDSSYYICALEVINYLHVVVKQQLLHFCLRFYFLSSQLKYKYFLDRPTEFYPN